MCRLEGVRRGEAVSLPWSAVDWDKRLLTVYATKTDKTAKNSGKRVVPIVPRLYDILLAAHGAAEPGAVGVCGLTANNLLRDFEVIRKRAGLAEFGEPFQTMRRSRAQDSPAVPMNTLTEWNGPRDRRGGEVLPPHVRRDAGPGDGPGRRWRGGAAPHDKPFRCQP